MPDFVSIAFQSPLATALGFAGLACQLIWPLFRRRRDILIAQLAMAFLYGAQYALMGKPCGALVCAIGSGQTILVMAMGDRVCRKRLAMIFLPPVALATLMTWAGPTTLLAMTACTLIMIGRAQCDTLAMRSWMLAAAPLGIAFDLAAGALPALLGGLASLTIALVAYRRDWLSRRAPAKEPAAG
ncbi:MAG: YgjV family protein [Paracoccaceae bacterium]|nr:YgjV family protein [Paracoccaceae bacterium]